MPTYNPTDSRYLVVTQTRTRNGQTDIKIVLDLISNEFYTLDDDGNFNLIAAGVGSQTLEEVLTQGNTTGDIIITSPDTLTSLEIFDGYGFFTNIDGNVRARVGIGSSTVQLQSVDTVTTEISLMEMTPTQTLFQTFDANGVIYGQLNVRADSVILAYDDTPGGINHELKVDIDGYFLKNLPAYQDDAAAGTAGVIQGYLYQTDGTGAAPLDVAGIVMIKQ